MLQTTSAFAMNACDSDRYWRLANSHSKSAMKELKKGLAKLDKADVVRQKLDSAEALVEWVQLRVDAYGHFDFSKRYYGHAAKKWRRIRNDCDDDRNYQSADEGYDEAIENKRRMNNLISKQKAGIKTFLRRSYKNIEPMYIKGIQAMMSSEVEIGSLFTSNEKNQVLAKLRKENKGGRYNRIIKSLE